MKRVVILVALAFSVQLYADSISDRLLRSAQTSLYTLSKVGVKAMKFKMRIEGLKENLNKRKNLGKIKELYFKVAWNYPKKLKVEVVGLPKGFQEIKEQLKMAVYARLPLLFPVNIIKMVEGYKLKYDADKKLIVATDPTGKRGLHTINLKINSRGQLEMVEGMGISGRQETDYTSVVTPWSQGKFVTKAVEIKVKGRGYHTVVSHAISYTVVDGFGVPQEIASETKIINLKDHKEQIQSKVKALFYDYKLTGVKK